MIITLRRIVIAAILAIIFPAAVSAQDSPENRRDRFFNELRGYKHEVLAKELNLTKEQQKEFFTIYDEMDDRLQQISTETRDLEKRVEASKDASQTELEAAANAVYSQKEREGKVEMEYFDRFKEILSPRQLLKLRAAERSFTQRLVRHHRTQREGIRNNNEKARQD